MAIVHKPDDWINFSIRFGSRAPLTVSFAAHVATSGCGPTVAVRSSRRKRTANAAPDPIRDIRTVGKRPSSRTQNPSAQAVPESGPEHQAWNAGLVQGPVCTVRRIRPTLTGSNPLTAAEETRGRSRRRGPAAREERAPDTLRALLTGDGLLRAPSRRNGFPDARGRRCRCVARTPA